MFNNNNTTILFGDLNAKNTFWNCVHTNSKGIKLKNYAANNKIVIMAPLEPTHYIDDNKSDILDIALIKNVNKKCNIFTETALSSNHLPVHPEIEGSEWLHHAPPLCKIN